MKKRFIFLFFEDMLSFAMPLIMIIKIFFIDKILTVMLIWFFVNSGIS